jgi:AcrR family transcriptional regulator
VASRAGVGSATIFRRFATKDELIDAVLEARLQEMLEIVRDAAAQPAGLDAIRSFLRQMIEVQLRDKGLLESVGKRRFALLPAYALVKDEMFSALDVLVRKAREAGEVRDDLAGVDLPVLLHSLSHAALMIEGDAPDLWLRYLDLVCDGLRPGVASPLSAPPPTAEQLQPSRTATDCG